MIKNNGTKTLITDRLILRRFEINDAEDFLAKYSWWKKYGAKYHVTIKCDDYKIEKAYYSLEILKKVENNEYMFNKQTIENFENILEGWLN